MLNRYDILPAVVVFFFLGLSITSILLGVYIVS